MKLSKIAERYPVLGPVIDVIKKEDGIDTLFPPQAKAVESGYLDGENMLLTIPTSSGKTLVSELGALKTVLEKRKKVLYLVPLKALAMEKYKDFNKKYSSLGVRTAVSIGNFDNNDSWLERYDIIVTSVEKADSLLRHKAPWFSDISLVIADEIHLLDDPSRGPTLEVILTWIRELSDAQIIGLSATINNREELAGWLSAKLVESDFRPTVLHEGYYDSGKIVYPSRPEIGSELEVSKEQLRPIVKSIVSEDKQAIIFVSSKKGTEKTSEDIASAVGPSLDASEKIELESLSNDILSAVPNPTRQCRRLAKVVLNGSAFHHSGLVHKQKELLEDAFRSGIIKVVCATTTLAYGMNLPCDYVVMRDVKRFYGTRGYDYIPVLEYKQCVGRAGRAKYSGEGRSIIVMKETDDAQDIKERFIYGLPENIYSKLSLEPVLRIHLLSLISTGYINDAEGLKSFMSKTFYAHQFKDLGELFSKIERMLDMLSGFGMVVVDGDRLSATRFGKRVTELYLDPVTADMFASAIKQEFSTEEPGKEGTLGGSQEQQGDFVSGSKILEERSKHLSDFGILNLISQSLEMMPLVSAKKGDEELLNEVLVQFRNRILVEVPSMWDWDRKRFMDTLKTTLLFDSWIKEENEDFITKKYGITPGALKIKLDNADWLLYSLEEFSKMFALKDVHRIVKKMRLKVKYGVPDELLNLVVLKGVGRQRARKLYDAGIRHDSDIKKVSFKKLSGLVGPKTASKLKKLVGVYIVEGMPEGKQDTKDEDGYEGDVVPKKRPGKKGQMSLDSF